MKKLQWRGFVLGILISVALMSIVGTAAATVSKTTVEVDYNNIKVTMDGQAVNLVDANGVAVEPFIIDGTTYLPVRAVANALGLDVKWDEETKTVELDSGKIATLQFSFGQRTGTYHGGFNENGLPHGQGIFTTTDQLGEMWTYLGGWKNGHMSGTGVTEWTNGQRDFGNYENDELCGVGIIEFSEGDVFIGSFTDHNNATGTYATPDGTIYHAVMVDGEWSLR